MRRVIPPSEHNMFCPRPHPIPCIPPPRALSVLSQDLPVRTRTDVCPPIFFSQTLHPRPLAPPSLISEYHKRPAPKQRAGSFFPRQDPLRSSQVATPRVTTVVAIWFRWCRVANAEHGAGLFRRIYIGRRRRGVCVWCSVCVGGATKSRMKNKRNGFWWDAEGMGWRVWTCERVES